MDYEAWRDRFAEILDPRRYTLEWLDGQVSSGRAVFWGAEDAAMLTELRRYPTGVIEIHGLVAAGDMKSIIDGLIPRAEDWARKAGCIAAVIESRAGWARQLRPHGYELHQTAIRKDL